MIELYKKVEDKDYKYVLSLNGKLLRIGTTPVFSILSAIQLIKAELHSTDEGFPPPVCWNPEACKSHRTQTAFHRR